MRKIIFPLLFMLVACRHENKNEFTVTGKISNADGKMIYLQETPLGTGQRLIVDSAVINDKGDYRLKANRGEEALYQLVLKDDASPVAFVINDAATVTINVNAN